MQDKFEIKDLSKSKDQIKKILPELSKLYGKKITRWFSVEASTDPAHIELDVKYGVDLILEFEDGEKRAVSSRIQEDSVYPTMTIRYIRGDNTENIEYSKRLREVESGSMKVQDFVMAYIDTDGIVVQIALVRMPEIISYIKDNWRRHLNDLRWSNDGKSIGFFSVYYDDIRNDFEYYRILQFGELRKKGV